MARVCQVTGKSPMVGNNVSHSNNRTKRRFLPNLQYRRFWVESENHWVRLRVSTAGLRTIDKNGIDWLADRAAWSVAALARVDDWIDRTFIDEHDTRWIIDYKSSSHGGSGVETFLDNERERYRGQLERYRHLFAALETRPVRMGLYFPLLGGWREVESGSSSKSAV